MNVRPTRRALPFNAAALLGGRLAVPVINAAVVVLIARRHGAEALGAYSLLVGAFILLDQGRLLGLQTLVTRELAMESPRSMDAYRGMRAEGLASAVVAGVVLVAYAWATRIAELPAAAVVLAAGFLPSTAVWTNDALFLARQRADRSAIVVVVEAAVRGAASAIAVWWVGVNLVLLCAIYAAGRLLAATVGLHIRRRLVGPVDVSPDWTAARGLLRYAPAFAAVSVLPLVLLRCDLLVLGWLGRAADVGQYSAAARLVTIALLLPDSLLTANFVQLARAYSQRTARAFGRQALLPAALALVIAVPAAAVVAMYSTVLASAVFGAEFVEAARYLAILIWGVPLFVLTRAVGDALIARGEQVRVAIVLAASAVISLPTYVLATQAGGATGTALASLASAGTMLVLSLAAAAPVWRTRDLMPGAAAPESLTP